MSKVIYLSGPMSGLPKLNYPAFARATKSLRARGYTVQSPHELDPVLSEWQLTPREYARCIGKDITRILSGIDGVVVLPDWTASRGAAIETFAAYRLLSLPVWYYGPSDPMEHVSAVQLDRAHLAIRG